uniref:4-coumarate--CoA ligase 1-like n=1 Tax=Styela clava TaxID=7725 RepID=UPI0019396C81|nr:4-coumarate--CoA ligase 1-like [Styela clava]
MPLISRFPEVVIPQVSLTDYIFKSLYQHYNRIAIVDAPTAREITFGEIANTTVKCASALARRGLKKGDIVATCASNSPEYVIVLLAAAACGATITTCNPMYTEHEIKHQFQHSEPKMAFVIPGAYESVKNVAAVVPSLEKIYTIGKIAGVESFDDLISNDNGSAFPRNVQIDPCEDILFLPYSSGTTGLPKGVMLTHHNFISCITMCKINPGFNSDSIYSVLPLFHIYGLLVAFVALDQGLKHVLDVRFNLENWFQCIEKYKVTRFSSVPPMLLAIAKSPLLEKYDLSSLLTISSGAAPLPREVASILASKLNCPVSQGWGLTECVPITMANLQITPYNSVGSVCANTKIKVIDIETGAELGAYKNGELCVKGPQIMKGYFKNPTATTRTIDSDGWLHTGDIGYYDDNEMIFIIDRLKELIKYKGFQVAPAELEEVLVAHPKIADAAVVGIPDFQAGELAKAYVVPKDPSLTKDEIHKYIAGQLSKYKHLYGGIEFRDYIAKSATGKILRRVLREEAKKSKL